MSKPPKTPLKAIPKFANEKAERDYWESHDSTDRLVRIPLIVTDDSGIVTGDSGDRDRCHG
jgi:hypothetical protein